MIWVRQFEHSYLSNLSLTGVKYKNRFYESVEHAYQVAKCAKLSDRRRIRKAETAKQARSIGKRVQKRKNWDRDRVAVMKSILMAKFSQRTLKQVLDDTHGAYLIEMNRCHDTFWGVCTCTKHHGAGLNMLGRLLMDISFQIFARENESL